MALKLAAIEQTKQLSAQHQQIMANFAVSLRYSFWLAIKKTPGLHRIYSGIALLDSILSCKSQLGASEEFKLSLTNIALQIKRIIMVDFKLALKKAAEKSLNSYGKQLEQLAYCMTRLFALGIELKAIQELFLSIKPSVQGFLHQAKQIDLPEELDRNKHYQATANLLVTPNFQCFAICSQTVVSRVY